jgi:hypothetical protein
VFITAGTRSRDSPNHVGQGFFCPQASSSIFPSGFAHPSVQSLQPEEFPPPCFCSYLVHHIDLGSKQFLPLPLPLVLCCVDPMLNFAESSSRVKPVLLLSYRIKNLDVF